MNSSPTAWPELSFPTLEDTVATLQLWSQIVGKIRLAQTPWLNHAWHVTLRVSARGLRTPLIHHGASGFELEFDLIDHALVIRTTEGVERRVRLKPRSTASFYADVMQALSELGLPVTIDPLPTELPAPVPFPKDTPLRSYDPAAAHAFWRALVQAERVFGLFRTRFLGKASPIHLFWGAFDLAVTRFSGRRAPLHPGGVPHLADAVTREAYSHEVSSAGFWVGSQSLGGPCFYSYAYPSPTGFGEAVVAPEAARFDPALGEFVLPYAAVRGADDPDTALLSFLQSTYEAAATLADWNRGELECGTGRLGLPRPVG